MPDRYRAYAANGDVIANGDCETNGDAMFTADEEIVKVVFYSGLLEEEFVSGSVDITGSGSMTVPFPVE